MAHVSNKITYIGAVLAELQVSPSSSPISSLRYLKTRGNISREILYKTAL